MKTKFGRWDECCSNSYFSKHRSLGLTLRHSDSEFSSISTYNKCPGDANTAGVGTHFKQHWPRSLILRKLSETLELHFRNKTHQNVASLVEGDKAMLMWPTVQFDPDYPSFSAEILVSQKTTQSQANWKVDPLTRHARLAYHGSFIMFWSNWCFA